MAKRKHHHPICGLFTPRERRKEVARKLTALDRLNQSIDWEALRPVLEQNLDYKTTPGEISPQGGRPPYNIVLMFKILILQKAHALSDDQCEHQILDRTSFQRFLGLDHKGRIPDAKLIESYTVTRASVHDSQALSELLDERDAGITLCADSAYRGEAIEAQPSAIWVSRGGSTNEPTATHRCAPARNNATAARAASGRESNTFSGTKAGVMRPTSSAPSAKSAPGCKSAWATCSTTSAASPSSATA